MARIPNLVAFRREDNRKKWLTSVVLDLVFYLPKPPTEEEIMKAWGVYWNIAPHKEIKEAKSIYDYIPTIITRVVRGPLTIDSIKPYIKKDSRKKPTIEGVVSGVQVYSGLKGEDRGKEWTFTIRGVKKFKGKKTASFCEVLMPADTNPELLHKMAMGLADVLPFMSGHGGYAPIFDASSKSDAFERIYEWAKRYWGLDVEDLNRTLPEVLHGTKGVNWLTLLNPPYFKKAFGAKLKFSRDITMEQKKYGYVIRAGKTPTLGDMEKKEFPKLYAEVDRGMQKIRHKRHEEFERTFDKKSTMAWLNRLVKPEGWRI